MSSDKPACQVAYQVIRLHTRPLSGAPCHPEARNVQSHSHRLSTILLNTRPNLLKHVNIYKF